MELARSVVSRLRQFVGDRRRAKRQKARISFTIFLPNTPKGSNGLRSARTLPGHTLDLSETGLALIVPTIRLGEHHLVGENREFNVKLELPDGPVEMRVAPVRYETLDEHQGETGFLIGVTIVEMGESERSKFADYLLALAATNEHSRSTR